MTFPKSKYVRFYYPLPCYMNIIVTYSILISETISGNVSLETQAFKQIKRIQATLYSVVSMRQSKM